MNPEIDQLLSHAMLTLAMDVAPSLPTDYAKSSATLLGMMLRIAAAEYERGAEIRVAENADLRRVLADAAPLVDDAGLRGRLQAAAESGEQSLRISELNATNAALRRALIELHAHVETVESQAARRIEQAIWAALRRSTERRALPPLA